MSFANQSLEANRRCLDQAVDLLDRLDDHQYADRRGDWSPVGAQYRHVIEHYQCLLGGASSGRVDYDSRRRDPAIELSRGFARETTVEIRGQLAQLAALPLSHPIAVQIRSGETDNQPEWSGSTLGRELQFLLSHTVHHFALIKLLLQPDGVALPSEFGTAPSTLAHDRARQASLATVCTVSWTPIVDGYALYFNRDERRTRGVGAPPVVRERDGVSFVAPIDPDAGGTWIGVNDRGVSVCLLNRYGDTPLDPVGPRPSRGLLVLELLVARTAALAIDRVGERPLGELLPFTICAVDSTGVVHLADWTGTELLLGTTTRPGLVRTSSGSDQRYAELVRAETLDRLAREDPITPDLLERFHRSHLPERGLFSVCMHRDEAETQSLSIVQVGAAGAALEYAAGSPCLYGSSVRARLPRAA